MAGADFTAVVVHGGRKEVELEIRVLVRGVRANKSTGLKVGSGSPSGLVDEPFQADAYHVVREFLLG